MYDPSMTTAAIFWNAKGRLLLRAGVLVSEVGNKPVMVTGTTNDCKIAYRDIREASEKDHAGL
jgi:hypothetical protein